MNKGKLGLIIIITTTIGMLVGLAGSQNGQDLNGMPIYMLCVGMAFAINWLAFFPAYLNQTEKFYDITGSITFITITILALVLSDNLDARSLLLASLIFIWTGRLGIFLLSRVLKAGKDDRFDKIKPNFLRFFLTWTLQAIWVIFSAAPALIAITTSDRKQIGAIAIIGVVVWLLGFTIEVISDHQKSQFRKAPENKDRFITTGLWSRSRHPNYFGEIVLWIGVTIIALPVLQGWQWIALISPVFITLLLTRVSGLPMLEAKAQKKWGGQEDYEAYKAQTPILIPKLL